MKKVIVLFVFGLSLVTITASAQNDSRGGRRELMRQRLIDSLQLNNFQADSVAAIRQEFQPRIRQIMMDQSVDEATKATLIAPISQERRTRLRSVLTDDQITKLEAIEQRVRAQMSERSNN